MPRTKSCDMFALSIVHDVIERWRVDRAIPVEFDWHVIAVELANQILEHDDVHYPTLEAAKLVLKLHEERS